MALLRRLGTACPGSLIDRYGAANVAAALYYVACQSGRYLPRNPGGLVSWLLAAYQERRLQGWQLKRILVLARFRDVPHWVRMRLLLWAHELQTAWLGSHSWKRLRRRYGDHDLEQLLWQHPQADTWRCLRYLLATRYRLLPSSLKSLLGQARTFPEREAAARKAEAREEKGGSFAFSAAI